MSNIQMDFVTDWQLELIQEMKEEDLQFSEDTPKDSLIIKYFNYLRKQGQRNPRKVHKSREFICPSEYELGLSQLIKVLENGDSFSPYLSKQVEKLTNDGMFNDWGVLHLHLGENMESDNKYIERTGPLLFLYLKNFDAYLINIFQHHDWTKKEVLQIVQNNWPELIEPYRLKGVVGLATNYTDQQHQQLRNAGISVMLELIDEDGNKFAIIPPGMGIASSGDSITDVRNYQDQIKYIRRIENQLREQIEFIKDVMEQQNVVIPETFKFKLLSIQDSWKVKEEITGLIFELS